MHLRRGEPLADRHVPANVGKEDRQEHDRPALGCALDATGANLRVLPRRRIADPPDGSRIGAAERGVAEFATPRARQEPEQPPTCPKRQRERVLPGKDPRPACAHRWDPVRVIARLLVCHSAQTSLGDAHRVPLRIAGSFRMCWSDRSVITTATTTCQGACRSRRARTVAGTPRAAVSRGELGERPHGKGRPAGDAERDCEEAEPLPRKSAKVAEVLDNEDSGSKEARPSLRGEIGRVVDIPEIDTDERGTAAHEEIEYLRLDVRPGLPVPGRPPALVPPRADDHRPVLDRLLVEFELERAGLRGGVHDQPWDAGNGGEREPTQIVSVLETVERGVETRGQVTPALQYLWACLDDVSEVDEPTHLPPPVAAEVPAAGAAVDVDRFVLLVASGSVPVRPGGQSCEPGRVPAVTDEVAVDAVGRRGSGRPEEPLLDAHVGANPGAAMVAEEAEVSGSSVDDAAVYKRAVVEPDHHALLPGGFDAAVDSSAFQRERDKVGTLRAAPADVSHDHVSFDPSRHDADARINADFEVRRERAFDLVPIGRFRAVDGLLSSHSCGRPQVLGLRCARCDKGGDSERHATPKTKTTHDELTPLASLHCFRL